MSTPTTVPGSSFVAPILSPENLPNTDHLITEDGKPVDSIYAERLMQLLRDALRTSWSPGRPYFAAVNVGVFWVNQNPCVVPDFFLAMDVVHNPRQLKKSSNSYFIWEKGKPPDLVVEIVSDEDGGELTDKIRIYAEKVKVPYYVVWDPKKVLTAEPLHTFALKDGKYIPIPEPTFPDLGLKLKRWTGDSEGWHTEWLRWYDLDDRLLETGAEVRRDMEAPRKQADAERQEKELLAAKLRELGIDPDTLTR